MKLRSNPNVRYPTPWDTYATLPISVPLSEALAKTRITPNQITILSFFIALLAIPFFAKGTYTNLIVGALIYQLSYIFDCVDGYIARKNKQSSHLGYWLDHILDEVKLAVLVTALAYGQVHNGSFGALHADWVWIFAILYVYSRVFGKGDLLIKFEIDQKKTKENSITDPLVKDESEQTNNGMILTPLQQKLWKNFAITTPFSVIESQAILFVIGPLFNIPVAGLIAATTLALLWHFYMDAWRFWRKELKN